ncbi:MAG: hypothetical protein Tsb0010_16600 [Parvularculaceae bacterium]
MQNEMNAKLISLSCFAGWHALVFILGMNVAMAETASSDDAVYLSRVMPETVYREARGRLTRLNFDFELANPTDRDAELTYLELRAFDARGRILARRYMGGNGLPGPVEMLPERTIPAGGALYVFNPFSDFATASPVARVLLRVFHSEGSLETEIFPVDPPGPRLKAPPIAAEAYVYSGNDLFSHHRRVSLNSVAAREIGMDRIAQRFALDFTALDPETGDLAAGDLSRLESWFGYGLPVAAPADGRIVAMRADMPDNRFDAEGARIFDEGFPDFGENRGLGNYVMIETGGAYLLMAHFAPGSITVGVGDEVVAGQPLGIVGLSGDTAYPHLHIQLQDGPDFLHANPLPIVFDCVRLRRDVAAGPQSVDTGDFVRACARD